MLDSFPPVFSARVMSRVESIKEQLDIILDMMAEEATKLEEALNDFE